MTAFPLQIHSLLKPCFIPPLHGSAYELLKHHQFNEIVNLPLEEFIFMAHRLATLQHELGDAFLGTSN